MPTYTANIANYPSSAGYVTITGTLNTSAGYNGIYSIAPATTSAENVTLSSTGIELKGNSDIKVNGVSLMESIRNIESRLAILKPVPELEAEWDELKRLGDEYRALESEIREKMKTWDVLKK